ncbi:MAG: aspartate--ammonia ligase [Bacteroidales bacterium]|nr:aspartate--ammonia ligase [Bacteroidales bacterium]MBN2697872.1 aspartate--ammonia ligase [Bacteroidales bacterium]
MRLILPEGYAPLIGLKQTERAIELLKDQFEDGLSNDLRLRRVTAPLFLLSGTGLNDYLTGIEHPIKFKMKDLRDMEAEVVQSLAKWKRMMLRDYDIQTGYGIFTDMNALRPDEELDNMHSIYVDQWDWEKAISLEDRNLDYLKRTALKVWDNIKRSEFFIHTFYPHITPRLPEEITFIHSEELFEMYPDIPAAEREDKIAEKYGAVFIIGIGSELPDGKPHDRRASDYDDWSTETEKGFKGLNGDIIVWNSVLKCACELTSMGIRVDREELLKQLEIAGELDRKDLMFHRRLLNDELPHAIGGGIGQSRTAMILLQKAHIGEIQSAIWPGEMVDHCRKCNIRLI